MAGRESRQSASLADSLLAASEAVEVGPSLGEREREREIYIYIYMPTSVLGNVQVRSLGFKFRV